MNSKRSDRRDRSSRPRDASPGRRAAPLLGVALMLAVLAPSAAVSAEAEPPALPPAVAHDGSRDFDFEFGDWKMHLLRRLRPLTGSNDWVQYEGDSVVRKVWGGKANLGEISVSGKAGHIEGMSLRLYNPQTHQWSLTFANSAMGIAGTPMIGGFADGRGEFYDQETYNDRSIYVRFIFSDIGPRRFHLEQAFSADGGRTWEANWIATFTR
jgi:hypothetical protein